MSNIPPTPDYDEADRAAVRRHNVELLTRMNDAASAWAIELLQTKPADPAEAAKTGATFERMFRSVRRAILLIDRLMDPRPPAADPGPRRARHRDPDPAPDDDDDEDEENEATGRPTRDRIDRLDRLDTEDQLDPPHLREGKDGVIDHSFDNLTEAELIAALCEAAGLPPVDEAGKPRTLQQINAIHHKVMVAHEEAAQAAEAKPPDTS